MPFPLTYFPQSILATMNPKAMPFVIILLFQLWSTCLAEQCGSQAGGKLCPNSLCCSQYGYCGSDSAFCGTGCQSQCGGSSGPGVSSIISSGVFDRLFDHRSDGGCPAHGFYTHDAFLTAASAFSGFGTTGDTDTAKRELAAFFANAAHETTGGCYKQEIDQSNPYCSPSAEWPCAPGKYYYGRGPLQISWNYNYGPAGRAINFDGINNPEIVASDPVISFKTAIWFWMTPQSPKPSCHSAITGGQGFGETINIINGGLECGGKSNSFQEDTIRLYTNSAQEDRIRLYKSYCGILGVQPGDKLTC